MTSRQARSLDEALAYASANVGAKKAAQLMRAAAFSDDVGDSGRLGVQLATALVSAVDRHLARGAVDRSNSDWSGALSAR